MKYRGRSGGSSGADHVTASSIESRLSPTDSPPRACPSKPSSQISSIERRRSSGSVAPWVMPKTSCPSPRGETIWRRAQVVVSSTARIEVATRRVRRRAHVQAHRDVRAEPALDLGDRGGRQPARAAVVHGAERHAVVVEAEDRVAQREDLEAARIGEDRAAPGHEPVQAAERLHGLLTRPEVEVVGVREQDRRAEAGQLVRIDALDARLRAHRHEGRRRHVAVSGAQHPGPRLAVGSGNREVAHGASSLTRRQAAQRMSIASPKE